MLNCFDPGTKVVPIFGVKNPAGWGPELNPKLYESFKYLIVDADRQVNAADGSYADADRIRFKLYEPDSSQLSDSTVKKVEFYELDGKHYKTLLEAQQAEVLCRLIELIEPWPFNPITLLRFLKKDAATLLPLLRVLAEVPPTAVPAAEEVAVTGDDLA